MMDRFRTFSLSALTLLLVPACSGTTVKDSWSASDYKGKIQSVYIIGIAKDDLNRMLFEDTFSKRFAEEGIRAVPSYRDLPKREEVDRDIIIQKMQANGCDSVLLTKLVGQRTETNVTPGTSYYRYTPGPYYGGVRGYSRPYYYDNWGSYYRRGYEVVYQPPTATQFVILTVESVLYDLKTEKLIWSARLETEQEGNLENMMQKFVDAVSKDLKEKGLI